MTKIPLLTKERALELLEDVVIEAGSGYVYDRIFRETGPSCAYVRDGQPSCIVGRAMAKHGVPLDELAEWDRLGPLGAIEQGFILDDALEVLDAAQRKQDNGAPWGVALAAAKDAA